MNNCTFSGRLTKDPELLKSQEGKYYTRFCLAVKRRVKDNNHPQSDFIDCIAFEKTAEIISQYCKKGSQIGVIGRMQTNSYDKDGEKRKSFDLIVNEVDLIGGGKETKAQEEPAPQEPQELEPLPFEI